MALKTFAKLIGDSSSDAIGEAPSQANSDRRVRMIRVANSSSEEREKTLLVVYDALQKLRHEVQVRVYKDTNLIYKNLTKFIVKYIVYNYSNV